MKNPLQTPQQSRIIANKVWLVSVEKSTFIPYLCDRRSSTKGADAMMKVVIITLMTLVPLVGSLFGDRYFGRWFTVELETAAKDETA